MSKCRICQVEYVPFLSFGKMPLANGFLASDQFRNEYFFELVVAFCPSCCMVQLSEQPSRERMFTPHYAYFSSTSTSMATHFEKFSHQVIADYLPPHDPFVVEIGCNDGILLEQFAQVGIRHLGIEPSANVAQVAVNKGLRALQRYFDEDLAREIVAEYGQADAVLGANVLCHIPYLHSVVAGIKMLLKPGGVLVFEDPYLGDILDKTAYDQIYDEHAFYFSVTSVRYLFQRHGLEVVDVMPQNVHGGSMRYVVTHEGARKGSAAVMAHCEREKALGLEQPETFEGFRRRTERSREELMALLYKLKRLGKRVVGYGATSKSTTVINYCGITRDLVEFISDTTPIKQGKFSPGAHIPVRPYTEFTANYPDHALLFAWNHAREIIPKERGFQAAGGKWIVYVPKVQILI